jgi:hypothetical protein
MVIMSGFLSDLLGAREPQFTHAIKELETASGDPSADVRLITDITTKIHRKKRELGLDPNDTTGKELYSALKDLVKKHDQFTVAAIGGRDDSDVDDILSRLPKALQKLAGNTKVWAIKASAAKRLLQKTPPRGVMKHLGYRSIDSMLKRESVAEIYAALRFAESPQWLRKYVQSYTHLKPSDFEIRDIEIVLMDSKRWGKLAEPFVLKKRHNITALKEFGVIAILPLPIKQLPGVGITTLGLLLHYINELRLYSAYFKFQQVKPHFGQILIDTLLNDPPATAIMAHQPIHWRIIQRYYGKQSRAAHPEIFEPHVQPEDLSWKPAEDLLYKLEPALLFWQDLGWVGAMHNSRPLSFNLMDNAINYCNSLPYAQRAGHHLRDDLLSELLTRYLDQKSLERQVLKQLDNETEFAPAFMAGIPNLRGLS